MKVEALPEGKYLITDGEHRIELAQTSYEDVYYACPIDNGSLFLLLNDTVLEDPNDRTTLKKMVDKLGGIEPAMTVLQEHVKDVAPAEEAAPAAPAEEENPFTTTEETDFVKVTIKGAPPTEEAAPEPEPELVLPSDDDLAAAPTADVEEILDFESAPPPPEIPVAPAAKPTTPPKPILPAKAKPAPVPADDDDEMPVLEEEEKKYEEIVPSRPKGGVGGKPGVTGKPPATPAKPAATPAKPAAKEPAKPAAPGKPPVPVKAIPPTDDFDDLPDLADDEVPVLDDAEETAPVAKKAPPVKPTVPPKGKPAPVPADDDDEMPVLEEEEKKYEEIIPSRPKGGVGGKPGIAGKPPVAPAKPSASPAKPGATPAKPAAKEPAKPAAPGKPPVPAKATPASKGPASDDEFDNLPDLADDEVPVIDDIPEVKAKPSAPAAKGGAPGKPAATPAKPAATPAKPAPAAAGKPGGPGKEVAGVGGLDLKKPMPPKPGAKPAGGKATLSLEKRGPNEFVLVYGELESKLNKAQYTKLYETCPIDTSSLFRILMAEILEGASKAAFRKIIATAGHSKPILDALNEKVQELDPD